MLLKKIGLILARRPSIFAALTLAVFVFLPQLGLAQGTVTAVMSLQQGDAACGQPPSTTAFQTTDAAAHAWVDASNAGQFDTATIQFYDPNNNLNSQFNYTVATAGHTCFTSASLQIANAPGAPMTGTWTMKFLYHLYPQQPAMLLASVSFTISSGSPLTIATTSLPNAMLSMPYSATVNASGGSPPYTFGATGLPSLLNISPAGAITGTETAAPATYQVTVKATDSLKTQVTKTLPITVDPYGSAGLLTITTPSLANGVVGQNYSQPVNASGGIPPYSFSATGLPSALQISATSGTISGIPAAIGTYKVTVTVYDQSDGGNVSKQFQLTIDPAIPKLTITTPSLAPGGTGQMYSQSITATGGTAPYTFSASGLPMGLNIGPSGNITGTPTANGNYSVTITVVDAARAQATRSYTLLIISSLTITTPSLANGSIGHSYFQTLTAVGGTIPFTFSATGLPQSLRVTQSAQTIAQISGTPSVSEAGTYTVDVTVIDAKKASATAEFTLIIYTLPVFSTPSPLPDATGGAPYTQMFSATGGLAPYRFFLLSGPSVINITTAGVLTATFPAAGPVTLSVQVIDANNNASTKTFAINVAAPLQQPAVAPLSLQFTSPFGGELPGSQNIGVSGGSASAYQVQMIDDGNGGPTPAWLRVGPLGGAVPGVIHVSLVANTMPPGTYMARVRITAGGSPIDVSVTYTVITAKPNLSVSPTSMRFSRRNPEQVLTVRNSGGGGPLTFSATAGGTFITSVTPSSGQTPAVLRVRVNTGAPGASRDSIHISTTSAGNADVPASLFVPAPGPALAISQTGFRFQTVQGAVTSTMQTIRIFDVGDTGTTLSWTAELLAGIDWLSLGSTSGTATPTNPGTLVLKTAPGAATLAPGGHYALIRFSAPGAQGAPQYAVGVIDVAAAGAPVAPDPAKGGLFFAGAASGAQPAAQILEVGVSSATPVKVVVAPSTADGGKWLTAATLNDSASSMQTAQFAISANSTGMKVGVYTGELDIAIQDRERVVGVTFVVAPAGTTFSTSLRPETKTRDAGGCVATQLALTETGLVNNFSVPAGWPATLEMQLNDDCGSPVTTGNLVASFSNGDPPITLLGDGQTPLYSATWQPGTASGSVAITLNASAPGLPATSQQLTGGVNANATPAPSLVIDGLLHNVNPVVGAPLSPGTVSQVYGTNLASSPDAPTSVPLPTNFKGVQVLVGGLNAPLYYISPNQLTIQVPSELTATNEYQAIIAVNNAYTLPQPVDLVPVAPGVVAFPDGSLVAQHSSDYSLVSAAKPAKPGEALIIYLVGLGATSANVPSGTAAPGNPLALTSTSVTVTIDGQTVQTPFVGLTPGGVGLYQINLIVPPNAKTGKLPVTITQAGVAANATTLLVQQ